MNMIARPSPWRRPRGIVAAALLGLFTGGGEARAQIVQVPGAGIPTGPFTWAENVGPGTLPKFHEAGVGSGWNLIAEGVKVRIALDYPADPTFEVIVDAPFSGHPTIDEIFLIQVPRDLGSIPISERSLVVAFHPFGVSHKSPFLGSRLPQECARRGWILVSPGGLSQVNFANADSQRTLDTVLALVEQWVPFDRRSIYTVGFSMGGANALSYAMRKQDPDGLRVAGVVCHTGTLDVLEAGLDAGFPLDDILEDLFGSDPQSEPFPYERVSPAQRTLFGPSLPDKTYARNLIDVPIYFHHNAQDPNTDLVADNRQLYQYLLSLGFDVHQDQVQAGFNVHKWSTLRVREALEYVSTGIVPPVVPTSLTTFTLFVDEERPYRFTEVLELDPNTVGRFEVALPSGGSNVLGLSDVVGVRRLSVDLGKTGLDLAAPVQLATSTLDGAATELLLVGYPQAPSSVFVNGSAPTAWAYDPATETLSIVPTPTGSFGLVDVLP